MTHLRRAPASLLLATAAFALPLAGCDERFDAELASVAYTAPVRLTSAPAATVDAGPLPGVSTATPVGSARRVFSLGAPDGDERYLFGRVADLALSGGGDTLYVLDRMERRVRAFSREGRFLFGFGRQGKGPGEYEDPVSLAVLPWNGHVAVWDLKLQRLTLVTPEGETVRTVSPLRQTELAYLGKRLRAWRGGMLLELNDDALTVRPERQRGYLARLDTAGAVRDTVLDFFIPPIRGRYQEFGAGKGFGAQWDYAPTWTPRPEWDLLPEGGVVLAPGGRYELLRFAPDGAARLRLTRTLRPERVTWAERVAHLQGWKEREEPGNPVPAFVQEWFQRKQFARVRPQTSGVLAGADGEMLVRRFHVEDDWKGRSRTWDVYRANGQPAGSLRFARDFHPQRVTADRVYGVRQDSLGVDYVEAYRR